MKEVKMTKAELIGNMAAQAGITKITAEKALNSLISALGDALGEGDKITLVGFGTFEVAERSQREGRNPRTGESIVIPPSKVVKFKAGSKLREAIK